MVEIDPGLFERSLLDLQLGFGLMQTSPGLVELRLRGVLFGD